MQEAQKRREETELENLVRLPYEELTGGIRE